MIKWIYGNSQRLKAAALLAIVMGSILVTSIVEKNNVSDLDKTFSSMYEDRLLPATYIFNITDHLYQKRLLWETDLSMQSADGESKSKMILSHNSAIDCLLEDFEKTFLVQEEKKALEDFKKDLQRYNRSEASLLKQGNEAITAEDRLKLNSELSSIMNDLYLLSLIQVEAGKQLQNESRSTIETSAVLSHFEIVMLIVVGVMINIIILSSKTITEAMKRDTVNHWQN